MSSYSFQIEMGGVVLLLNSYLLKTGRAEFDLVELASVLRELTRNQRIDERYALTIVNQMALTRKIRVEPNKVVFE